MNKATPLIEQEFIQYCIQNNIGEFGTIENNINSKEPYDITTYLFSDKDIKTLFALEKLLWGEDGGLVLGKSHENKGILVIRAEQPKSPETSATTFFVAAEMQGWEYILSKNVADSHSDELLLMNTESNSLEIEMDNPTFPYSIDNVENIIDTENKSDVAILMINWGLVIHHVATKKNIARIDKLQSTYNQSNHEE